MNTRRLAATAAVAALTAVAVGGIASADDPTTINACVQTRSGNVRIDTSCTPGETPLSWNQTGPVGPQGPPGADGAAGPQGVSGPTGPQGPTGISHAVYSLHKAPVDVPSTPNGTVVSSVALPAGTYVVTLSLHDATPINGDDCSAATADPNLDTGDGLLGFLFATGNMRQLTAPLTLAHADTLNVTCFGPTSVDHALFYAQQVDQLDIAEPFNFRG